MKKKIREQYFLLWVLYATIGYMNKSKHVFHIVVTLKKLSSDDCFVMVQLALPLIKMSKTLGLIPVNKM